MSADNWRMCPQCEEEMENRRLELMERLNRAYGSVPSEEYLRMVEESKEPTILNETLREDYGFSVEGKVLFIRYKCHCDRCGFVFEYKENVNMET